MDPQNNYALDKRIYIPAGVAVALVMIGFLLMSGGGSNDPSVFSDEIFSFRRITLAPIVVLAGYTLMIVALILKPGQKSEKK